MPAPEEPKIIVDSDWKSQAQAEKDRLAAQEAAKAAATQQEQPVRFEDVVGLLATQAMSYMGYFPDPQTGQTMISLEYARLHIDMLGILEAKTKGNLSPEESDALTKTAAQLRGDFVELQKAVAKAVAEGKIKPRTVGGAGAGIVGTGAAKPAAPMKGSAGGIITPP